MASGRSCVSRSIPVSAISIQISTSALAVSWPKPKCQAARGRQQARYQLNQRISDGNRVTALVAASPEPYPAQHGNIVPRADR